jgi:glyoxylase-like metal-dependent hydrolase (beta-lactamase superfamily II)/ketosteroid isomerase-like protein
MGRDGNVAAMPSTASEVVSTYFDALTRRDLEAMAACWAPDGEEHIAGQVDAVGPDGVRAYFGEIFSAFPDFSLTIRETVAEGDKVAVHWGATGTFAGPAAYQGIEPTGARIELEGLDLVRVADGLIVRNDAFADGVGLARQIGLIPEAGSSAEERLARVFNARTRAMSHVAAEPERIADGVWLVRGGFPLKTFNVFLIEDGEGVTVFDAGIRAMTNSLAAAGQARGGITRVVLGHSHADHRGAAPGLRVPVWCHSAERVDAESDGGAHYIDLSRLRPPARWVLPRLRQTWDGGPVEIERTLEEGDEVAGFRVVHLPGHAPGMIALWRESDRLALSSDCFYTLDIETSRPGPPRVPHPASNQDTEQARASVRKLAALEPATAWPGHADPVTGDVRAQLEAVADG